MAGLKGKLRDTSRSAEIVEALDGLFAKAGVIPEVRSKILEALQTAPPVPMMAAGAVRKGLGSAISAAGRRFMEREPQTHLGKVLRQNPQEALANAKAQSTQMGTDAVLNEFLGRAERGDFSQ